MSDLDPSSTESTRVRALYGVPLADFVKSRDALARAMRVEGDRPAASRTAALRRPTPGAWALNQVVRRDEPAIHQLLETAAEMRAATEQALAGDARALRALAAREREVVRRVVDAASEALRETGKTATDQVAQKIALTVRAALADEELGALLRVGMLTDDVQPSGFGLEALSFTPTAVPKKQREAKQEREPEEPLEPHEPDKAGEPDAVDLAREHAEREQRDREAAEREQRALEATRLEAEAERLAAEAERLAQQAQRAEDAARSLRVDADGAAATAADARDSARRAREQVDPPG